MSVSSKAVTLEAMNGQRRVKKIDALINALSWQPTAYLPRYEALTRIVAVEEVTTTVSRFVISTLDAS